MAHKANSHTREVSLPMLRSGMQTYNVVAFAPLKAYGSMLTSFGFEWIFLVGAARANPKSTTCGVFSGVEGDFVAHVLQHRVHPRTNGDAQEHS